MNREAFIAFATEEGLTISEADAAWDARAEYNIIDESLTADEVRQVARAVLPTVKKIREYYGSTVATMERCPDCGEYGCPTSPCGVRG